MTQALLSISTALRLIRPTPLFDPMDSNRSAYFESAME